MNAKEIFQEINKLKKNEQELEEVLAAAKREAEDWKEQAVKTFEQQQQERGGQYHSHRTELQKTLQQAAGDRQALVKQLYELCHVDRGAESYLRLAGDEQLVKQVDINNHRYELTQKLAGRTDGRIVHLHNSYEGYIISRAIDTLISTAKEYDFLSGTRDERGIPKFNFYGEKVLLAVPLQSVSIDNHGRGYALGEEPPGGFTQELFVRGWYNSCDIKASRLALFFERAVECREKQGNLECLDFLLGQEIKHARQVEELQGRVCDHNEGDDC